LFFALLVDQPLERRMKHPAGSIVSKPVHLNFGRGITPPLPVPGVGEGRGEGCDLGMGRTIQRVIDRRGLIVRARRASVIVVQ
jgi:hypothetical protein